MALRQAMTLTDAAAARIQALLVQRGRPAVGIRVGVRSRGCSGLTYTLEYADERGKFDEVTDRADAPIEDFQFTPAGQAD